jgi:hypothetical protein
MEKELDEQTRAQMQALAELAPTERVRAAEQLLEGLEQELEQASASPEDGPNAPVDRDEEH